MHIRQKLLLLQSGQYCYNRTRKNRQAMYIAWEIRPMHHKTSNNIQALSRDTGNA
jgi:hypothetical protein